MLVLFYTMMIYEMGTSDSSRKARQPLRRTIAADCAPVSAIVIHGKVIALEDLHRTRPPGRALSFISMY